MKTVEDVLVEITPIPDPDFVAEMEERMQQGFPPAAPRKPWLPPRKEAPRKRWLRQVAPPRLQPRLAAATAGSLALALAVTVSLLGEDSERGDTRDGAAISEPAIEPTPAPPPADFQRDEAAVAEDAGQAGGGSAPGADGGGDSAPAEPYQQSSAGSARIASPAPPADGGLAPGRAVRRVEHSAQITLAADPGEFDGVADEIFAVTGRHRGFVLHSNFTESDGGSSNGFFELRIPSARLEQALNDLSGIATVRSRSEAGTDVTAAFVSLRDRLTTALAERKGLLRRLELAPTETAAIAIRRRLGAVNRKIASLRAGLRRARERTEFATVVVELVDKDTSSPAPSETDEAFDDAVGSLEGILNLLIRALGVLVPVGLVALVAWTVASRAKRRARERALA